MILKLTTFVSFILLTAISIAQPICLGNDATVCVGTPVQIQNCGGGASTGNGLVVLPSPTSVSLSDDSWSGVVNIGFTFSFYGVNYTQCVIGSNGLVSFNTANAGGYCSWSLNGTPLPMTGNTTALNTTMLCYQDINPGIGGQIYYQTIGTAPNRKFYVVYANIPMFSSGECQYMSLVLNETSNNVEYYIGNKSTSSSGWNGSLAIQAVQNNGGTAAVATTGRNNTVWTCSNDGRLYTPTSPSNTSSYTVTPIPYVTVTSNLNTSSFVWKNTLGQTFPYNNGVLNIPSAQAGTVGYFLSMTSTQCQVVSGSLSDTSFITGVSASVTATSTPDICSSGQGTVTANPGAGMAPFTFNWPALGATTQSVTGVFGGTYLVKITDAMGCQASATVTVTNTPATFSATSTIVSCPGGNDGTATATMTPVLGTVTYLWDDPAAQTTQTAVGLTAGTYNCVVTSSVGCSSTVTVTVTEIPGMIGTFTTVSDVTCHSMNDGIIEVQVTQGTAPYSYSWDQSTSTSNRADDLFVGTHTVTITDALGCVITMTNTLNEPAALKITSLTPDSIICPENKILLKVAGQGGSTPYTFTWSENGNVIGTGDSILVDPVNTNTQYCVELTEVCGSPKTDSCMRVNFPPAIVPQYVSNLPYSCLPGAFTFFNQSQNANLIDSVIVDFGNNKTGVFHGNADISYTYTKPGIYTMTVTAISERGCVTTNTFPGIANVLANPIADFNFTANPTSIFETTIGIKDNSTSDVTNWQWYAPGSDNEHSIVTNPIMKYPEGVVGTYEVQLIVTTNEGCVDTVSKILSVLSDIIFYSPNTFTPDGDEFNQTWKFHVDGVDQFNFELLIFDRWGELVWETHDVNSEWDGTYHGKIIPEGTYVWIARVKDLYSDSKRTFNGTINLIR